MNKHHPLTEDEISAYRPQPEFLRYIRDEQPAGSTRPEESCTPLRVLDWGCGRGRMVAYLIREGVSAYGVDPDPDVIENGRTYFDREPGSGYERISLLQDDNSTTFPDGYFDIVISDNVLEHVSDLPGVFAEISRITRPGGWGLHIFPARFTLHEGHLMMPFVHWLPKGPLRRLAIKAFTRAGIEPRWTELDDYSPNDKAEAYFAYSRDKTFYRSAASVVRLGKRFGFAAELVGLKHPRLARLAAVPGLRAGPIRRIADTVLADIKAVELLLVKPADSAATGIAAQSVNTGAR